MKKFIFSFLTVFLLFSSICAHAWDMEKVEKLQEGITYKNILRYQDSGFLRLHILECDLTDERVSIGVITSKDGSSYLDTTKKMAEDSGAVAAINGDFFNVGTKRTNALGMSYIGGELISSPSKDLWATFALTDKGNILMNYFGFTGKIVSPQGYETELYQINKVPVTGGAITMLTNKWGDTVTLDENMSAMLISGDEVLEIISAKGEISFGDADKMLVTNHSVNGFFENFTPGDEVIIEYEIMGANEKISEAIGGNTLLLLDGKEAYFNHNVSGKAQRTAVGINKDGTKLYMLVSDGRTASVSGLTQNQMAEEMIKLGAYTAINLDGGGSSTMVYRNDFSGSWDVLNSQTTLRKVSNSLGIFNKTEYIGKAVNGEIKISADTVLKGDYLEIYYKFTDKNGHIVYPEGDVIIKTDSAKDKVVGNKVYFNEGGLKNITVSYDGVSAEGQVYVLDKVSNILIYPENITIKSGETENCSLTVWDIDGKKAYVHPESVDWIADGVKVNNGKIGYGTGYVGVEIDGVSAFASVNGGKIPEGGRYKSNFENGQIDGAKVVRISSGSGQFTSIADMIRTLNFEYSQEDADELYLLNTPIMRDIKFNKINAYSEKTLFDTKFVTINSEKGTINSNGQIEKILELEDAKEKNIVIITKTNISGLPSEEAILFKDVLDRLSKKGKNLFYLYSDDKIRCVYEDGVNYISYPKVSRENSNDGILGKGTNVEFYVKDGEISFSFR